MANRIVVLISTLVALCSASLALGRGIPALTRAVTDEAGLLSDADSRYLEDALKVLYQSGGSQIAVLTIESLEGEPIESYSIKVVDTWKLGSEKGDNGALLLVSKNDRKMRIEVGQGLEGLLTDLHSKRIIDQVIAPRFRSGDFSGGIVDGVRVMAKFTDPDKELKAGGPRPRKKSAPFNLLILAIVPLLLGVLRIFTGVRTVLGLTPSNDTLFRIIANGGSHRGGIYRSSGSSSSRGSSGGSSGGGFSGGGGGFSGGGASGGW